MQIKLSQLLTYNQKKRKIKHKNHHSTNLLTHNPHPLLKKQIPSIIHSNKSSQIHYNPSLFRIKPKTIQTKTDHYPNLNQSIDQLKKQVAQLKEVILKSKKNQYLVSQHQSIKQQIFLNDTIQDEEQSRNFGFENFQQIKSSKQVKNAQKPILKEFEFLNGIVEFVGKFRSLLDYCYPKWIMSTYPIYRKFLNYRKIICKGLFTGTNTLFKYNNQLSNKDIEEWIKHGGTSLIYELERQNYQLQESLKLIEWGAKRLGYNYSPDEQSLQLLSKMIKKQVSDVCEMKMQGLKEYCCWKMDALFFLFEIKSGMEVISREMHQNVKNSGKSLKFRLQLLQQYLYQMID